MYDCKTGPIGIEALLQNPNTILSNSLSRSFAIWNTSGITLDSKLFLL